MARKQPPRKPKAAPPAAPTPQPSGPTVPRQFRFSTAELARIDALAHRWGPVKPLTRTDVLREALRRAWEAEFGKGANP
jgi:hypothetical protein